MKRKVCFEGNLRFRSSSYFQVQRCMGTTISIRPLKLIASLNERLDVYCLQRTFTITKCVLSKNVVTDQKWETLHRTLRFIYIYIIFSYIFFLSIYHFWYPPVLYLISVEWKQQKHTLNFLWCFVYLSNGKHALTTL